MSKVSETSVHAATQAPTPLHMERDDRPKPAFATEATANQWATDWYQNYTPKAHDGRLYLDPGGLFEQLDPGIDGSPAPVRLLRLSWLIDRAAKLKAAPTEAARRALAIPRRQLLEQHESNAFLSSDEVKALKIDDSAQSKDDFQDGFRVAQFMAQENHPPLKIIAISHGWLTPAHPDPRGEQLLAFADQVSHERRLCPGGVLDSLATCLGWLFPCAKPSSRAEMKASWRFVAGYNLGCPMFVGWTEGCFCCCFPRFGQGCCRSSRAFPAGECAVFYDYGSLVQKDEAGQRSPEEVISFGRALAKMGSWYGHKLTTVFSMSLLPFGWDATPYNSRGWPTFERAVSQLITEATHDGWRMLADPAVVRLTRPGKSPYRDAPEHPRSFAARLALKVFTSGKSDCELVAALYTDTLAGALGNAEKLCFIHSGWGDEEVVQFAGVMGFVRQAWSIDLLANPKIGRGGLRALAAALEDGRAAPMLLRIMIDFPNGIDATELRAICDKRGVMLFSEYRLAEQALPREIRETRLRDRRDLQYL